MFYYTKFMKWLENVNEETPHTSKYHKESFYEHVLLTANSAALQFSNRAVFIAALLHDIGKPETMVVRPEKGATFYNHETHLDLLKEFLTEDDMHYKLVHDLIELHMLPYQFNGPEPWRSYAEKHMIELMHTKDAMFMSYLFTLHAYDNSATFSNCAPGASGIYDARKIVDRYAMEFNNVM